MTLDSPTVGSWEGFAFYERGNPVGSFSGACFLFRGTGTHARTRTNKFVLERQVRVLRIETSRVTMHDFV